MRITVRLGQIAASSLDLDEIQAKRIYETFATILASVIGSGVQADDKEKSKESPLPVRYGSEEKSEYIEPTITTTERYYRKPCEPTQVEAEKSKLIFFTCSKCGELQYKFANENDVVNCHYCKSSVALDEVVDAAYRCPKCNASATFRINGTLQTIPCKSCHSPIDLKYHEKKHKYVSANLA